MNIQQFLKKCEEAFGGKEYTTGQKAAFMEKCERFSERDLQRIFSEILETNKYLPRIADIYEAAGSLGMLSEKQKPTHHWEPSSCGLCHGEGRLRIIWNCEAEERPTGIVEKQTVVKVLQYSKGFDHLMRGTEYPSIFRCKCPAGEADTIPKAWPQWTDKSNPQREVWL